MKRRRFTGLLAFSLVALVTVQAQAKDFTGKWQYSWSRQDGTKVESTIELKQDGDKVTGTITGMGGQKVEISDGAIKDGLLSFKVVRERDGNKFTVEYSGKLEGDVLKGKSAMEFNGNKREREFEAKRAD